MEKIVLILCCLAGLATSRLIVDKPRLNPNLIQGNGNGKGNGLDRLYTMTTDELLRQKFILDVLKQVELPLQDENLLQLRLEGITDENLYIGPLDDDMLLVLDLIRNNQILGRDDICTVNSEQHLRLLIGLYRLFARARDFETLQRIVVYARKYVNPVLFVNALTLALEDRLDTRVLIVPAIYEILPRLYNEESLIRVVENVQRGVVNANVGSIRPKILDIIELGRNTRLLNSRRNVGGGVIDRSQLWKPWRDMHRQLALQKSLGGRVIGYDQGRQYIPVRPISQGVGINNRQIGLIAEDVGLRAFVNLLLDELILQQDTVRNNIGQRLDRTKTNKDQYYKNIGVVGRNVPYTYQELLQNRGNNGVGQNNFDVDRVQNTNDYGLNVPYTYQDRDNNGVRQNNFDVDRVQNTNDYGLNVPYTYQDRDNIGIRQNNNDVDRVQNTNDYGLNVPYTYQDRDNNGVRQNNFDVDRVQNTNDYGLNVPYTYQDRDNIGIRQNNIDVERVQNTNDYGLNVPYNYEDFLQNRNNIGIRQNNVDVDKVQNTKGGILNVLNSYLGRLQTRQNNLDGESVQNTNGNGLNVPYTYQDRDNIGIRQDNVDVDRVQNTDDYGLNVPYNYEDFLQNRNNIGIRQNNVDVDKVQNTKGGILNVLNSYLGRLQTRQNNLDGESVQNTNGNGLNVPNSYLNRLKNRYIGIRQNNPDVGRVQNTNGDGLNGHDIETLRGSTDESDYLNAQSGDGVVNNRKLLDDNLPTTPINNDRLLHVSSRRLNLLRANRQNNGLDDVLENRDNLQTRGNSNVGDLSGLDNDRIRYTDSLDDVDRLTTQRQNDANLLQRVPRSLNNIVNDDVGTRIGQLILHHLQQVVARLNIEQISLRKTDDLVNNIGLSNGAVRGVVDDVVVAKINEISQRLEQSLQQVILHYSNRQSYYDQINAVDQVQIDHIALAEILQEVINLAEYVQGGQLSNILENSTTQLLLRHIINTVEQQVQRLARERRTEDVAFNGVTINNLNVDGLRTFVEDADVDLSNVVAGDNVRDRKIVIGRIPRLNHKAFTINLDLSSDRNQRVVVRTLLGPKTDALGRTVSLDQQRHNFVLLDIANVDLKVGRNVLKRKSRDIIWTGRDITPYSEIYERVMRALQGDVDLTNNVIVGQTNLFPHRLLVPRGRVDGLPMQLLVVVTPAVDNGNRLRQDRLTNLGINSLIIDNLPIRYPLDQDVKDVNTLLTLPNVYLKNVVIYHDE